MPVLRSSLSLHGLVIETTDPAGAELLYSLSEEGERFLSMVLGLHAGDSVRDKDLNLLIDRGWATRVARPNPPSVAAPAEVSPLSPPTSPPAITSIRPASSRRTRGREVALQVLYLIEQNPGVDPEEVERFLTRRLREPKLIEYTRELVEGVRARMTEIDDQISSVAENWRLDRMAAIDRNILRLGAYEMHHSPDIPVKVAINEALELAKRYSTAQSSRFVNGLLDRLQNPHAPLPVVPPSLADYVEPNITDADTNTPTPPTDSDTDPIKLPEGVTTSPPDPEPEPQTPSARTAPLASRRVIGRAHPQSPPSKPPVPPDPS